MNRKELLKKWNNLPGWVKNPYLITLMLFSAWMLFLDENNLILQYRKWKQLRELQEKRDFYTANIANTQQALNELKTNSATQEKFAREHYLMKKDNEEIFVFVPSKNLANATKNP
ncbi:MAG: septum formation initiator family protein [Chitinophagales bacterium]|nr:septum formation initiator family protein [Chitinophagales bacterium]MDW8419302.1 septum formation initiator family protein [Chitinophagales bacterium]